MNEIEPVAPHYAEALAEAYPSSEEIIRSSTVMLRLPPKHPLLPEHISFEVITPSLHKVFLIPKLYHTQKNKRSLFAAY